MMNVENAFQLIESSGVMAGLRGNFPPEIALRVASVMLQEGITSFEFLMNSVQPIEAMQAVKREFGDAACVGMGTVLNPDDARRVLDAGADFVVSPAFQPEVVQLVLDARVLMAPGVLTPTEAVLAWDMGVSLLKLFPAGSLGLSYFNALQGPLGHMRFMCNGGMDGDNAPKFIAAGAVACGMAGWLSGDGSTDLEVIRTRSRQLIAGIRSARGVPRVV